MIHLYRAGRQEILFEVFEDGIFIYEQIRDVELEHHGGPYMSLLQLQYDVSPFTFADVLLLRYLLGLADERKTMDDFEAVNQASMLNWSMKSQIIRFVKRFWKDPYRKEEINSY